MNAKLTDFTTATATATDARTQTTTEPMFDDDMTPAEFRDACEQYAEYAVEQFDTFEPVDMDEVTVEVSQRMERAAGKAIYKPIQDDLTIRFAVGAYEKWGWSDRMKSTIRHELVHCVQYIKKGDADHGIGFEMMADKVDVTKYCDQFTDYKYILMCSECGDMVGGRHRKSKIVTDPEKTNYVSPCCRATLESREA